MYTVNKVKNDTKNVDNIRTFRCSRFLKNNVNSTRTDVNRKGVNMKALIILSIILILFNSMGFIMYSLEVKNENH